MKYSKTISGSQGNYGWWAKFDKNGGYVGVNGQNDSGVARVLLSPRQVEELFKFVHPRKYKE